MIAMFLIAPFVGCVILRCLRVLDTASFWLGPSAEKGRSLAIGRKGFYG